MQRVRRAGTAALALFLAMGLTGVPAAHPSWASGVAMAASVAWPPSTLVVSEVQTGGASASDEFVEIANQGLGPVDLIGLEVVYATSSGSTVTRKATWTDSVVVPAGRRVLLVNGAGALAGAGDVTYSGGFAATGGAVALRVVGGSVLDAIGWGDATNPFVEGTVAPAPPAGSSVERRPGGSGGNGIDTNDNAADWVLTVVPSPQSSAAPPVPAPGATPTPTLGPTPSPDPTPSPTPTPDPTATPDPTPTATPDPTPTAPPTPTPIATPAPTPMPIGIARDLPSGTAVTVAGVLTTDLGALESGRTAFVQDASGGIAVYLDAAVTTIIPAGTTVEISGTIDSRYAQTTVRAAEPALLNAGPAALPEPTAIATGSAGEAVEGRRVTVVGTIAGSTDVLADGSAVNVDDGSGPVRLVIVPDALAGRDLPPGSTVQATGVLGQRDSSGSGTSGYRLYVTASSDLAIEPAPTPTPTPTPTSTPEPSPDGTPTPTQTATPTAGPSASPSPSPAPSSGLLSIGAARARPIGSTVKVRGVVIAEAGRLGTPPLIAIADSTGGIVVRLPDGASGASRGRSLIVRGSLADPYGQLEIRPAGASEVMDDGSGPVPAPIELGAAGPSEATEGSLVRSAGVVVARPVKATSGDITLTIETTSGTRVRLMADASSGIRTDALVLGARYRATGVAGQRASKKGLPDGYRIWLRDPADVVLLAAAPSASAPAGTPKPKTGAGPTASRGAVPPTVAISTALRTTTRDVTIDAVVTASATLLDSSGRRIVVQDSRAAIEVLLPKDATAPRVGNRVVVTGRVGSAYGAPRLRADAITARGTAVTPPALRVSGPFTTAHTWRLVSISGRVDDLRKLGDRWRAEVVVGAQRLVVIGQPGAAIPMASLVEVGSVVVTGIVRPAYPSATDRRPTLLPRSPADVDRIGSPGTAPGGATGSGSTTGSAAGGTAAVGAPSPANDSVPDVDLADLAASVGDRVRVGGLVVERTADGFSIDDGTATGNVVLVGEAAGWVDLVEPGDAINVIGRVEQREGTLAVVVDDPAAIFPASDVGDGDQDAASTSAGGPSDTATAIADDRPVAAVADAFGGPLGPSVSLAGLLLVSLASVGVTVLRRRQARRLLASRVAARLTALVATAPAAPADPTAVPAPRVG